VVDSPQAGDVYVTAYGTYGHTALVHNVNGGYVDVLEQNGSCRCVNRPAAAARGCVRLVCATHVCDSCATHVCDSCRCCSGAATYSISGAECFLRST
jgi:surface antigen